MPRKHRRRPAGDPPDVTRLAHGGARVEVRRGAEWRVREIPAHRAEKPYRCPGCANDIVIGQAHLVAWRADHLLGEDAGVRDRRHWHAHCWRVA